jgi:hypothetical protein
MHHAGIKVRAGRRRRFSTMARPAALKSQGVAFQRSGSGNGGVLWGLLTGAEAAVDGSVGTSDWPSEARVPPGATP